MKPVDSVDNLIEVIWCDHTYVAIVNHPPTAARVLAKDYCYFVIEEGKLKILCPSCFAKGLMTLQQLHRIEHTH